MGLIQLTPDMTKVQERAAQNSNNLTLNYGRATLDNNSKVVQDPESYGKANGAALNPSTLPTAATIMALLGGNLSPASFDAFATGVISGGSVNNRYIKFPDGTLICIKRDLYSVTLTSQWGSWYEVQLVYNSPWPVEFVADDTTVIPVCRTGSTVNGHLTQAVLFEGPQFTNTQLTSVYITRAVSGLIYYDISFIAIGRWK